MGITLAIENDVKHGVYGEIQLKGGMRIGAPVSIPPGKTFRKTDRGLSASCVYNVVVYDLSTERNSETCQWSLHVRAPATAGTKTVKVSDILGQGKKSLKPTKLSRDTYVSTLWNALDINKDGDLELGELTDWVLNERFVRLNAFRSLSADKVVRDMLAQGDDDKSQTINQKEFKKYFRTIDKEIISTVGYTIIQYSRAKIEAAIMPFYALDMKAQSVVDTRHFSRWFSRKAKDPRTLKIYDEMKESIEKLQKQKDVTFWEWMNIVCPLDDDKGQTITRTRLLCSEILGLCVAPSHLYNIAPKMNIVIMICGSRGDVQPFIPIGQNLKKIGHRVRLATHENFRDFVTKNGLEFYPIGGDPKELMAYMVKTKGQLMPGIGQLVSPQFWRDTNERKKMMDDIIMSVWHGANSPDEKGDKKDFVADVIISNPPTYSHVHCAEAMGVPLHMMFTMPWSPTAAFPHPMGNVAYRDLNENKIDEPEVNDFMAMYKHFKGKTKSAWVDDNVFSYRKVDLMMHVGMGASFEKFRKEHGIEPKWKEGSSILSDREVPFSYIWSPSLIPKPLDWGQHIDVVGFSELPGSGFTKPPPKDIDDWIKKDELRPPIFIGFGSCVLPDSKLVAETIYKAAKEAKIRVIIQQGWAGLGKSLKGLDGVSFVKGAKYEDGTEAPELDLTREDFCLVIGRVAHSWLFDMVAGVVHHGGAGTTYAGLKAAKPTLIAPFFGDQPFWGQMVTNAGAGPKPTSVEDWKPESLAEKFKSMFTQKQKRAALKMSKAFKRECGAREAVRVFHEKLNLGQLSCDLFQSDVARFWVPNWKLKLGEKSLKALIESPPKWFAEKPTAIHRYKSFNWVYGGMPSYSEEIKDIDTSKIVITDKQKETILRNLKAILDIRGIQEHENAESLNKVEFIHPDPRLRV